MSAPCLTIDALNRLKPCPESGKRVIAALRALDADVDRCFTAADARAAGCTFGDIAWAASVVGRKDKDIERRIRLFLADCAVRVLPIYETRYPGDTRPRDAITATRDWAQSVGTTAAAAWAAEAAEAARAAGAAGAAWAARAAEAAGAAWAAEAAWQFDRLIEWLSDNEPEPLPLPPLPLAQVAA